MPQTDSNNEKISILKNTRETKGLTLEIVHEATKIPMDALRAIEEGYTVRILSPFYYRGFIKIYAEFLGLNVGEMYKQYGLDQPAKAVVSAMTQVKSSRKVSPQPNVFLEQMQEWFFVVLNPRNFKLLLKIIGFLILLILIVKWGGCFASHMHKKVIHPPKQPTSNWQEKKEVIHRDIEEEKSGPVVLPPVVKHETHQAQSESHKV